MSIRIRLIISLIIALISIVITYLFTKNINIIFLLAITLFLATIIITSLFNIENASSKKKYLFIIGIVILTNTYFQYMQDSHLGAALGFSYVGASILAFIIRFFTLLKEKFYNKLPD